MKPLSPGLLKPLPQALPMTEVVGLGSSIEWFFFSCHQLNHPVGPECPQNHSGEIPGLYTRT